jgi:hypothetical protein
VTFTKFLCIYIYDAHTFSEARFSSGLLQFSGGKVAVA